MNSNPEILVDLVTEIRSKDSAGVTLKELRLRFSQVVHGDVMSDLIETPIYSQIHQLMEWGLIEAWYRGRRLRPYHFRNELRRSIFWRYQFYYLTGNFERMFAELERIRFYPTHQLFSMESIFGFRFTGSPHRYFRLQDIPSPDVFVAMPFLKDLEVVYEQNIKPVCKMLGLAVLRGDDISKGGAIIDQIWTLILESRLIIVDCSLRNPNVFFELGLAQAIGRPTLLITKEISDIPFDIAHHRVLKYTQTVRGLKDFKNHLSQAISEILELPNSAT